MDIHPEDQVLTVAGQDVAISLIKVDRPVLLGTGQVLIQRLVLDSEVTHIRVTGLGANAAAHVTFHPLGT